MNHFRSVLSLNKLSTSSLSSRLLPLQKQAMSSSSLTSVPMGPPDPILGLNDAFLKDTDPRKVNLGVGAYRDDEGKPYVLQSVRRAEQALLDKQLNHEYLPIAGLQTFISKSLIFAYGEDSEALNSNRVAAIQTLSGTGGCRVAAEFISRFNLAADKVIYQPDPTWGNHVPICVDAGLTVKTYPYYDRATNALALTGWLKTIETAKNGSAFLVHACAHNPTGLDPNKSEWEIIADAMKAKNHIVLMDCAYQGFASGNAETDAFAIRLFVKKNVNMMLVQSFAKNFGLYNARVGTLSVLCPTSAIADNVLSQLKILVRPVYSNPPAFGARIVSEILSNKDLTNLWVTECKAMANRIHNMRTLLVSELKKTGSKKDWSHVVSQIGMFCYTGLNKEQSNRMVTEFHVYMTSNGRISMAGITTKNAKYVAQALHECSKDSKI